MKSLIIFMGMALLAMGRLAAQQSITVRNVTIEAPAHDLNGKKGVRILLDIQATPYIDDFNARDFDLDFALVTPAGNAVYESRVARGEPIEVRMYKPSNTPNPTYMEAKGVRLFIPMAEINLPTGHQKLAFVVSVQNDLAQCVDCFRKDFEYDHVHIESKTFAEQVFTVSDFKVEYGIKGFAVEDPGMNLRFALNCKYGPDQIDTDEYLIRWKILSTTGKVLFDSREGDFHHQSKAVETDDFPKTPEYLSLFVNYVKLKMDGPGEAVVVLEATQEGHDSREIYRQTLFLNTPQKYRFEQQEFQPGIVYASRIMYQGVQGLQLNFSCQFKYTTPLIDPERGDFYFFAFLQNERGDTIFSPAWLRRLDYATTHAWDGHNPLRDTAGAEVSLFIPLHRLKLAQGPQAIQYTILVTDIARRAHFPIIARGKVQIEQPRVLTYQVDVRTLEVIPGNYDAQFAVFGSPSPDLEWRLEIGEDTEYQSGTIKNSHVAAAGTGLLKLSEGDEINLGLWDVDSGFFNRNDILGRWRIPYAGRGDSFVYTLESQGIIRQLEATITRKAP